MPFKISPQPKTAILHIGKGGTEPIYEFAVTFMVEFTIGVLEVAVSAAREMMDYTRRGGGSQHHAITRERGRHTLSPS